MKQWTRRSLLIGGSLLSLPIIGLSAGKLWCRVNSRSRMSQTNVSFLLSLYSDSAVARTLGSKYLKQAGTTVLAAYQRIEAHDRITRAVETGCDVTTFLAVEQACCDDFRSGRVYCIDGWVLAQTELDFVALFSVGRQHLSDRMG